MVTCIHGEVALLGPSNDISVDFICIMNSLNKLKEEDKKTYHALTKNINLLIKDDEEVKEAVMEFIENLHDIL